MDTGTLDVKTIFNFERRLAVPMFQRPYVWAREEQWQPLWDDLRGVVDRLMQGLPTRAHFLGAVVLDQQRTATGHIEQRLVIDGQQRLTTMQLLLMAFRDACDAGGWKAHAKSLRLLTTNQDVMSGDPDDGHKVWPTNVDQDHYRRVVKAGGPEALCREYGWEAVQASVGHQIPDAYLFFNERIKELLGGKDAGADKRLDSLFRAVREHLRFVVIDLGPGDDAQLIFETLNARGTPLLPSDLVKNYLFHRAQTEGKDLAKLYEAYWQGFDTNAKYWRKELGRGHARRPRIDTFLQNYLTLRLSDEVGLSHLYAEFKDRLGSTGDPEERLKDLKAYADVFHRFDDLAKGSRESLFFDRLATMGVTSAHPFLMEVFVQLGSKKAELHAILGDIESFLVRRMVCQLNTRGYNRLFLDALKALHATGGTAVQRVRQFLLASSADSARWPADAEFRQAWMEVPLARALAGNRNRMLLEGMERRLRDERSEKLEFGEKLTIEHLLPQRWSQHWQLPAGVNQEEARERRDVVLHTMGNLTLLTKKLNPGLSNREWAVKLPAILEHSALALNRKLQAYQVWDEAAIAKRGLECFAVACREWGFPDSAGRTGPQ